MSYDNVWHCCELTCALLTCRVPCVPQPLPQGFSERVGLPFQRGAERYLSYLPLAHIYDMLSEHSALSWGAAIGYWRGARMVSLL